MRYISFNWTPIENSFYWIGLLAMGIFGFISHFIIIYAIQLSNLSFVTNFQYSQLLWSTVINFLIFGVPVDISKIIEDAVKRYKLDVLKKRFPKAKHSFNN